MGLFGTTAFCGERGVVSVEQVVKIISNTIASYMLRCIGIIAETTLLVICKVLLQEVKVGFTVKLCYIFPQNICHIALLRLIEITEVVMLQSFSAILCSLKEFY